MTKSLHGVPLLAAGLKGGVAMGGRLIVLELLVRFAFGVEFAFRLPLLVLRVVFAFRLFALRFALALLLLLAFLLLAFLFVFLFFVGGLF